MRWITIIILLLINSTAFAAGRSPERYHTDEWVVFEKGLFIAALYEAEEQTLTLQFNNGRLYEYYDVAIDEAKGFFSSASRGRYFNRHLRHHYAYRFAGNRPVYAPHFSTRLAMTGQTPTGEEHHGHIQSCTPSR